MFKGPWFNSPCATSRWGHEIQDNPGVHPPRRAEWLPSLNFATLSTCYTMRLLDDDAEVLRQQRGEEAELQVVDRDPPQPVETVDDRELR